jgi:hypothetical protein
MVNNGTLAVKVLVMLSFITSGPLLLVLTLQGSERGINAFSIRTRATTFLGDAWTIAKNCKLNRAAAAARQHLSMRDGSASYWFKVNDRVRVVENVYKGNINLRGLEGRVVETWEKCDVDPTCCCAEQVDANMAVRVQFPRTFHNSTIDSLETTADFQSTESFVHYFAEDELLISDSIATHVDSASTLAFDGMSCTAFKLEQLRVGLNKPRKIASFDASRISNE